MGGPSQPESSQGPSQPESSQDPRQVAVLHHMAEVEDNLVVLVEQGQEQEGFSICYLETTTDHLLDVRLQPVSIL